MSLATTPKPPRLVHCPHCGKATEWRADNPCRPFCSARCKEIDFGAWASGQYRVPAATPPDSARAADDTDA
ncbi:DNA gyrase inhibitor YacG [Betaproteobacteria bacterium]|nr:DNA gyrase inhibitor YacG [Betaproteobacteria bacterium]